MKLEELKGIGAKRREALNKLDIFSVEDLIAYVPQRYRDLTKTSLLCAADVDTEALFCVRCTAKPTVKFPRKGMSITTCDIEDVSGKAEAVWFNQPYRANSINAGDVLYLYGKTEIKQGRRRLMNPDKEDGDNLVISPVYRLPASSGISQKMMRDIIKNGIELCVSNEKELFTSEFRAIHRLAERSVAIRNIHFPKNEQTLLSARRRLCFEELISIQLYIKLNRKRNECAAGKRFFVPEGIIEKFTDRLPYELTNAQRKCIDEIVKDVSSEKAMNRLVQGDVGCGKTVVAFIAMMLAVENGGQAALMAPTEILAHQHYLQLVDFFGEEGVAYLVGSLSAAQKKEVLERIKNGTAKYIVGTNALIQSAVEYNELLLVVTDEQHRFGVAQRARLFSKGNSPHTLVMSATPIPRTLSLILFGDLDISVIDELPKGRKKVLTSIVPKSKEEAMFDYIRGELLSGKQAYFVCPLIEDGEETTAMSAEALFDKLSNGKLKGIPISLMHGKMDNEEKTSVMGKFARNEIKALISTTVIEVGVNVKNATIMVIYGADRFGLAQLHQLRGRVGRGEEKSYCFMLSDNTNPETLERLKIMTQTNNGFDIAQRDFDLRGPGDYLGKRQSGIAEARFSYALSNTLLLKETQGVIENEIMPNISKFDELAKSVTEKFDRELTDICYN